MSREAILEKIISDAQIRADAMVSEAQDKAQTILADTAEQCKSYLAKTKSETDKMTDEIIARGKTVAELDAKKLLLGAKSEILNRVFARALEKLRELDKDAYKNLLLGMLENAQNGDTVILSEREKSILTSEDIAEFAKEKGIKLTLSKQTGNFDGGMILSGGGVDKNFTFEVEIDTLRDSVETDIAKEIFG